jgi:hypothetical protein
MRLDKSVHVAGGIRPSSSRWSVLGHGAVRDSLAEPGDRHAHRVHGTEAADAPGVIRHDGVTWPSSHIHHKHLGTP